MLTSVKYEAAPLEARLAARLSQLRQAQGHSLETVAERSGISRATLSRLERGETSPTAGMLGALCAVYQTPLSRLIAEVEEEGPSLIRASDQVVWTDPETGFRRRMVSPPAPALAGEVIEGVLPPGADISYPHSPLTGLEHHLWLLEGALTLNVEGRGYDMLPGDCLRYRLFGGSRFLSTGPDPARYVLSMVRP